MKKEAAFSGLEAAIVLIAFVVVAAVFSYVMLGAGFFATQKSQEVTYSGLSSQPSNLVLDGQIYGTMANSKLKNLTFYLAVPEGGQPQKLSDVQFLLTVDNGNVNSTTPTNITPNTSVLAAGSKVQTTLTLDNGPTAGGTFTLEIKPKVGASTLVAKTLATGYNGGVII
jgi:flagellin FlaB